MASDLSERGIGFQAWGFAVVGLSSVVLLQYYSGSEYWLYTSFQTAATQLHWAFLVPLAALFDRGRKMFETRKAIQQEVIRKEVQKQVGQQIDEALKKALTDERQLVRDRLAKSDLPDDVQKQVLQAIGT